MTVLSVDAYGADPTGVADSTAAFRSAQAAGGAGPYQLGLSAGTYKLGTSQNLYPFGRHQGMVGPGSTSCVLRYVGSGTCVEAFDSNFDSTASDGGVFEGFGVDGYSAGASSIGMSWGNLNRPRCHDISIGGFDGASAIGLRLKNSAGCWSEQGEWTAIQLVENTNNVVFDTGSFDYSIYQFLIVAAAGQNGVTLQNGADLSGVRFELRGNFYAMPGNTAWVLGMDPTGGGTTGDSHMTGAQIYISVEVSGGTGLGPRSIYMRGGGGCQLNGVGVLRFASTAGSPAFSAPTISGGPQFGFAGYIDEPTLGVASGTDSLSLIGPTSRAQYGDFVNNYAYNGMDIYCESGEFQAFQLPNGATVIGGFQGVGGRVRQIELLLRQPPSGAAGTITWPSVVKFPGGVKTLSTANGAVDKVRLTYYPSEGKWYAEVLKAYA